jgi:hypothetical protein
VASGGRVGRAPVGQQPLVAGVQLGPDGVVDPTGARRAGPVGDQLGVDQQLGHAGRPALPRLLADRLQLAQQVGAAQRVGGVLVAPVRRPAVVHGHPGKAGQHPGLIHRLLPSLGVHAEQRE